MVYLNSLVYLGLFFVDIFTHPFCVFYYSILVHFFGRGPAKINTGASGDIFELVENARYYGSKSETGKEAAAHQGVQNWDYFVKQVQIDGRVYDLVANVRKRTDGEYVYSIQLNDNKKIKVSPPVAINDSISMGAQHSTDNIPNSAENVNSKSVENKKRFALDTQIEKEILIAICDVKKRP